jgi:hypothetical protein
MLFAFSLAAATLPTVIGAFRHSESRDLSALDNPVDLFTFSDTSDYYVSADISDGPVTLDGYLGETSDPSDFQDDLVFPTDTDPLAMATNLNESNELDNKHYTDSPSTFLLEDTATSNIFDSSCQIATRKRQLFDDDLLLGMGCP